MKKIFALFAAFAVAVASFAQTPEEIADKMSEAIGKLGDNGIFNRIRMTVDLKVPVIGTMSATTYILGDKTRIQTKLMGKKIVTWMDGYTSWVYNSGENTVYVADFETKEKFKELFNAQENMNMFEKDTDGYDVFLKKETDTAWYLRYKKKKSNKRKDDPKTLNFVVTKGTYFPISMSATMKGITVTIRDLKTDVTEKQVTFNKADYPGVKIVDQR